MAEATTKIVLVPKPEPTPDSWYIERRDALIEGDAGTLPAGYTCAEQRIEYSDMAVAEVTPPEGPAATLTSINPTAATAGGPDVNIQAIGTNFVSGDAVVFNSAPLATTFTSATQLDATILGASLTAGALPVVVRRGAVDTAPLTLTVT
jgi:hypothetical protein